MADENRQMAAALAKLQTDKQTAKKELQELKKAVGKPSKVGFGTRVAYKK